jgi:hypothetical protein
MEEKPRVQCGKCPWKTTTDPNQIPNGYCSTKHKNLENTIAQPGRFIPGPLRVMACHESKVGRELPCVGWLEQQLGPGNNLLLRLAVMEGRISAKIVTVGPQHERFEDTLPKEISMSQVDRAKKKTVAKSGKAWDRDRMNKTHRKGKSKAKDVSDRAARRLDKAIVRSEEK